MVVRPGVTPPAKPFRVLRGTAPHALYYSTEQARDEAGRRYANLDQRTVGLERWTPELADDPCNEGWVGVGTCVPVWQIKETVTPLRRLVLKRVAAGQIRWDHAKPHAAGCVFQYPADLLVAYSLPTLNTALLWLIRRGYARTAGDAYDPPKGSLVSATAQGLTELTSLR